VRVPVDVAALAPGCRIGGHAPQRARRCLPRT
jgi:hypothetical protein